MWILTNQDKTRTIHLDAKDERWAYIPLSEKMKLKKGSSILLYIDGASFEFTVVFVGTEFPDGETETPLVSTCPEFAQNEAASSRKLELTAFDDAEPVNVSNYEKILALKVNSAIGFLQST